MIFTIFIMIFKFIRHFLGKKDSKPSDSSFLNAFGGFIILFQERIEFDSVVDEFNSQCRLFIETCEKA